MDHSGHPKIVYLTSGAAGMFCGSCMHDNTLARALSQDHWDIQLVPTYTPIRTDESDVSVDQVFFGGINVFLQQKVPLLRYVPRILDRFLDQPVLIRRVTSRAMETDQTTLGKLAVSMLRGMGGNQRKEVKRLANWLQSVAQPDLILFTNILIGGCIPELKRQLDVPILVTLQGDDVFLDSLPEPYRQKCIEQIRKLIPLVDCFLVHTDFFRDYMSEYFGIDPERIHVTPLAIDTDDFAKLDDQLKKRDEIQLGYLARLAPEKGLHHLVDAFIKLRQREGFSNIKLKLAGWLGPQNREYADQQFAKLKSAGLADDYEYLGAVDRSEKLQFLKRLDLFSVPTEFLEPKGLYVLEALAAGVPVIQPAHGSFPELIGASGGGLLFEPGDMEQYVDQLAELIRNGAVRQQLAVAGRKFVLQHRNAPAMAASTGKILSQCLAGRNGSTSGGWTG